MSIVVVGYNGILSVGDLHRHELPSAPNVKRWSSRRRMSQSSGACFVRSSGTMAATCCGCVDTSSTTPQ
jgi:hypothetical protein